jgi:tetratricopeptide (TPR) repeat protein
VLIKRILYLFGALFLLASCSTKKNTVLSRAYHNVTARYNGYYYAGLNIDEGIYKIEKNYKDNFEKILPVFMYPSTETAKATFPEFDKAIKKSSFCIQRHSIKDSKGELIPSSGKWIDNCWIYIGISHFYKREIFSGLEAFEYVARTFRNSKDKWAALTWMAKVNNEIGSVSSSESIIGLLKNEKNLPQKVKNELPVVEADYYMRRGLNTEAATKLMEAARNNNVFTGLPKNKRARYTFIAAQLFEAQKDNQRAIQFYQRTIKLKPKYEMIFYSKIKMARLLDVKRTNSEKTKKDLLKMSKEFKNSDYYDVIFYTLGEIEEKEKNSNKAIYYYQRSVQTSTINTTQKALSYLRLGEIYFDKANYVPSGAYYDSAIVTLPKDHGNYANIVARKKTLETLIGYINTIKTQDSLQRLAKMDSNQLNKYIENLIFEKEREEARKKSEKEAAILNGGVPDPTQPGGITPGTEATGASFYFYNPSTVAFGVAEFTKKWGNRKYEENWRRINKALVADQMGGDQPIEVDTLAKIKDPVKLQYAYKKNLPIGDSLMEISHNKIIDAFYLMGSLYKEELSNTKKSIAAFEELYQRYPQNRYLLNTYYLLYRLYQGDRKADKSDYYKEKILSEFPDSEFAILIKNPNAATDLNVKKSEVEKFYIKVHKAYQKENYTTALSLSREGIEKFGKNEFLPKFEFIKSMSLGKLKGVDSLEFNLKLLVANHPKAEVTPLANEILLSIKKQKNPELFKPAEPGTQKTDTFSVDFDSEHFIVAILPDDPKVSNVFKNNLDVFNSKFYTAKQFNITSNLFGQGKQLIILKPFGNAKEAISYFENLNSDKDIFKGEVKKEQIDLIPILGTNLPLLYKNKNIEGYKIFYKETYKKFNQKQ